MIAYIDGGNGLDIHDHLMATVVVNPLAETIAVLRLEGTAYVEAGTHRGGDVASSIVLDGFTIAVTDVHID